MPRRLLQFLAAFFLTAIWLPATQHCTLDALGIFEAHVTHHDESGCTTHHDTEPQHAHDTCDLVESSSWLNTAAHLATPQPALIAINLRPFADTLALLSVLQIFSSSALSSAPHDAREHPQNWMPSRHFAHRAAPLSRAPSAILA